MNAYDIYFVMKEYEEQKNDGQVPLWLSYSIWIAGLKFFSTLLQFLSGYTDILYTLLVILIGITGT